MMQNDFGNALLRGEDPIDLDALTRRVLRRDRRRMWALGIVCVIAWMLVVMLPWATILPMLAKVNERQWRHPQATSQTTVAAHDGEPELSEIMKKGVMATFFGSLVSMFVAAACTVSLILLSRRATLRQVNARLMEISTQLKTLAATPK